jgi:hypothetical protein
MGHHNNVPDDYPMCEVDDEQTCFICLNTKERSASGGTDTIDHEVV